MNSFSTSKSSPIFNLKMSLDRVYKDLHFCTWGSPPWRWLLWGATKYNNNPINLNNSSTTSLLFYLKVSLDDTFYWIQIFYPWVDLMGSLRPLNQFYVESKWIYNHEPIFHLKVTLYKPKTLSGGNPYGVAPRGNC